MRHVAVVVLRIVAIHHPFLQLSPLADFRHQQFVAHGGDFLAILRIDTKGLRGFDKIGEQIPDDLLVERHAVLAGPLLG